MTVKKYKKKIFWLAVLFLPVTVLAGAVFFRFLSRGGEAAEGAASYNDTETIYDYLDCGNGVCRIDAGKNGIGSKELFKFYGYDADCIGIKTSCQDISGEECREKFRQEYDECRTGFSYGQSGSFETAGDLKVNGIRTYLTGYDNFGNYWYKSGFEGESRGQMAIMDNGRGVFFGGNLYLQGHEAYFQYGSGIIGWDMAKGEKISLSNGKIGFFSRNKELMSLTAGNVSVPDGLEVKEIKASLEILWQGKKLYWTPAIGAFSKGKYVGSGENRQILIVCDSDKPNCVN